MSDIRIRKKGMVSDYIFADMKPCTEADILYHGASVHINRALLDTGSNITVVNPHIFHPDSGTGEDIEIHGAEKSGSAHTYYCTVSLQHGEIILENVPIVNFDLDIFETVDMDLIIGMDVILMGNLIIKGTEALPLFTFII